MTRQRSSADAEMPMTRRVKPVRLYGDPFGSGSACVALRAALQQCAERGLTAGLCLSAVRAGGGTGPAPAAQPGVVELGDGARSFAVATDLDAGAIAALRRAVATPVPATAPVLVFAPARWRSDLLALAGLEWPRACAVLDACAGAVAAALDAAHDQLRWAGTEDPAIACDLPRLQRWAALPPPPPDGLVLHVGAGDPAAGSDVAVRAFLDAGGGRRLRIVLPTGDEREAARLRDIALAHGGIAARERLEFAIGPLQPAHAADCAVVLQPLRRLFAGDVLPQLLASGRPVVATRFFATALALGAPGTCVPIGGSLVRGDDGLLLCEPDPDNVRTALRTVLADADRARTLGLRARTHAVVALSAGRPAAPPARPATPRTRPLVVLEAPFFEVSSAAELSIETARALRARDLVDLQLVPTAPFRGDLDALRRRAPDLLRHLARDPGAADLWLASGWPPRAERPRCGTFALRVDWEYGALPTDLTPLLTQEADRVVVHSRHVERTVAAAGCAPDRIVRVPHGVDGDAFHDRAAPDADLLAWKGDRPAVLFVGGMVFRKGIDVLLRMALAATQQGAGFALVLKCLGHDQHYAGFHLRELVQRFAQTPGAPPVRVLDGELDRAQLPGVYRACDLLCHPYRGEGFGMPVLEARACGLPVLVTRGGATDDFAAGEGTVGLRAARRAIELPGAFVGQPWLLEPDAEAAGTALRQSLADLPALAAAARAQAAAVRAAHGWDRAAAALEALARTPASAGAIDALSGIATAARL